MGNEEEDDNKENKRPDEKEDPKRPKSKQPKPINLDRQSSSLKEEEKNEERTTFVPKERLGFDLIETNNTNSSRKKNTKKPFFSTKLHNFAEEQRREEEGLGVKPFDPTEKLVFKLKESGNKQKNNALKEAKSKKESFTMKLSVPKKYNFEQPRSDEEGFGNCIPRKGSGVSGDSEEKKVATDPIAEAIMSKNSWGKDSGNRISGLFHIKLTRRPIKLQSRTQQPEFRSRGGKLMHILTGLASGGKASIIDLIHILGIDQHKLISMMYEIAREEDVKSDEVLMYVKDLILAVDFEKHVNLKELRNALKSVLKTFEKRIGKTENEATKLVISYLTSLILEIDSTGMISIK